MTLPKTDYSPEGCRWLIAQLTTMAETSDRENDRAIANHEAHAILAHIEAGIAIRAAIHHIKAAETALKAANSAA
jgi:hypothetical protein